MFSLLISVHKFFYFATEKKDTKVKHPFKVVNECVTYIRTFLFLMCHIYLILTIYLLSYVNNFGNQISHKKGMTYINHFSRPYKSESFMHNFLFIF